MNFAFIKLFHIQYILNYEIYINLTSVQQWIVPPLNMTTQL